MVLLFAFPFVFTSVFILFQNDQQRNGYQPLHFNTRIWK